MIKTREALAVAVAAVIAVSLLWIGGETHYRGCVEAATASTAFKKADAVDEAVGYFNDDRKVLSGQASPGSARERRIEGCSRLPF